MRVFGCTDCCAPQREAKNHPEVVWRVTAGNVSRYACARHLHRACVEMAQGSKGAVVTSCEHPW